MFGTGKYQLAITLFSVFIILFFILTAPYSAFGQKTTVVVFDFQDIGVNENAVIVTANLLRSHLEKSGKFQVIERAIMDQKLGEDVYCYDIVCASELGQQLNAGKAVIGSLGRLGDKVIAEVKVINVVRKEIEFIDNLSAATEADLEVVMKRLADAIILGRKASTTTTVTTVTEQETQEPRRRASFYASGLKVGYMFPVDNTFGLAERLTVLDFAGLYEAPDFMVEALAALRWGDDASDRGFDFSVFYLLTRTDFSPYLGGGIGIHWLNAPFKKAGDWPETVHGNGLNLTAGIGLLAFRTYDFHLRLDLRFSYTLEDFGDQFGPRAVTVSFGLVHRQASGGGCLGIF